MPLADRVVFQMDQAAFTDKIVLWDIGERDEIPDMDCCFSLFACGDN